jgi:hypothetical protein
MKILELDGIRIVEGDSQFDHRDPAEGPGEGNWYQPDTADLSERAILALCR